MAMSGIALLVATAGCGVSTDREAKLDEAYSAELRADLQGICQPVSHGCEELAAGINKMSNRKVSFLASCRRGDAVRRSCGGWSNVTETQVVFASGAFDDGQPVKAGELIFRKGEDCRTYSSVLRKLSTRKFIVEATCRLLVVETKISMLPNH
ncbi:MAG: hypothetical protein RIQ81_2377 [Pseudomonadota bacterium]